MEMNSTFIEQLFDLVNRIDKGVRLEEDESQQMSLVIWNRDILTNILKTFKFKDIGGITDFPNSLPQPPMIDANDISVNYKNYERIVLSKQINSILVYSMTRYSTKLTFFIDREHLKKFVKKMQPIIVTDGTSNIFNDIEFTTKSKEYTEVTDDVKNDAGVGISVKKVDTEVLVFEKNSELFNVMTDIRTFFEDDTKKLYAKMDIVYKRGVIIYGEPGNGKSTMIRELIRQIDGVAKIIISPAVRNFTKLLAGLIVAVKGKKALIIIEDIDSVITARNRSEFLNILEGIEMTSGLYFVGTTNYPERIDPAFMNRAGRFDRTYKIGNPNDTVRREYFRTHNIESILGEMRKSTDEPLLDVFVKNSAGMSIGNLKELMLSTQYVLAANPEMSIEEAVEKNYKTLTEDKSSHTANYNSTQKNYEPVYGEEEYEGDY